MAEYLIQDTSLDAIADAIHDKSGASVPMTPAQMVTAITSIPSGASDVVGSGTVSFHDGTNSKALTIPFTSELFLTNFIVEIMPIRTWALVDDVWVERDSLDFTGITGFDGGKWHPLIIYALAVRHESPIDTKRPARYLQQPQYSNGTLGNYNTNTVTFDSSNNCLQFTNIDGYVCCTDGGLTFKYTIRRWSGE